MLAIAVVAVVVVGGVGAAVMLGDGGGDGGVTYHGNGYKTSHGDSTYKTDDLVGSANLFVAQDMEMYSWNTSADGKGTNVNIGEKIPEGVKDLYAQWVGVISFSHESVMQDQYQHIKISSSTTIQGKNVEKDMNSAGTVLNGTETKIVFECDTDCETYVNGGNVVFQMAGGLCASYTCNLTGLNVVNSVASGRTAEVSLSENCGSAVRFTEDVLKYTIDFRNTDNLKFHIETYDEGYDDPVSAEGNPFTFLAMDRSEIEIRIVCTEANSEVFGCQPTSTDKTFSYRTNGVNQPTVHYRVTSSNDGVVFTGTTVGNLVDGYAGYFLIPVGLAMSGSHFELDTQFVVEISGTAFSS